MSPKNRNTLLVVCSLVALMNLHCGDTPDDDPGDTSDADADGDSDGDSDGDTDGDTDGDGDGEPIENLDDLVGVTFEFIIEDRDWKEPASSVGTEIGEFIPTFSFQVTGVDGTTLETVVGTLDGSSQDACNQAIALDVDFDGNPEIVIGPVDLDVVIEGPDDIAMTTIGELTFTGELSAAGDSFAFFGKMESIMDARETAQLFEEVDPRTPEAVCTTISHVAGENKCFDCGNGDEACLNMKATNIEGEPVDGADLGEQDWDDGCL